MPQVVEPAQPPISMMIRNVGMAKLVIDHVTKGDGTWFVVVGALHVPGDDGLLDLLDDKRFLKIEQQARE